MADGRTEEARVAPPPGRPAGRPAAPANPTVTYPSSARIVEDDPDARRTPPPGPMPETAARFAAAMAAVEQHQAHGADRSTTGPPPQPAAAPAPRPQQRPSPGSAGVRRPRRARLR